MFKELKELIQLMHEHQLVELEVEREGMRIRLKKAGDTVTPSVIAVPAPAQAAPAAAPAAPIAAPATPQTANRTPIKSPMVGTFYRAPAPDAPPFTDMGQVVEVGQVICIIEAMKLMNEIKAEVRGRVVEIPIQNGDPVEFGQPLFLIEPA